MSTTVLATLLARIETQRGKKMQKPEGAVDRNTVVVGIMSDSNKVLYNVFANFVDEFRRVKSEHENALKALNSALETEDDSVSGTIVAAQKPEALTLAKVIDDLAAKYQPMQVITNLAKEFFWAEIKAQFPQLYDKPNISVYKGWEVGYTKKSADGRHATDVMEELAKKLGHM